MPVALPIRAVSSGVVEQHLFRRHVQVGGDSNRTNSGSGGVAVDITG
jgi:hypothetical protein